MEPITASQSTVSTSTPTVDQIITKACSQITFPIKVPELAQFSNDLLKTLPQKHNLFDTLFSMNYEAAQSQIAEIRLKLLDEFKSTITDDLSIQRCLKLIHPEDFNGVVSKEYIDSLENYYQFSDQFDDRGQQISQCFDDLLMLMMKLSQEYMKYYQLMQTWKNNLEDQMQIIKDQLRKYLAQCFYSFNKYIKRKVKKMLNQNKYEASQEQKVELIKDSYSDYKKNLIRQLKVSKWLLPQNILEKNLQLQEWNIKSQIGKLLHNKHDFILTTKKKISGVFDETKKDSLAQFNYLSVEEKKSLVDVLAYCLYQKRNVSPQSHEQLIFSILQLENLDFKYDWNSLYTPKKIKPSWSSPSQDTNIRTMINLYLLIGQDYTKAKRLFLRDVFRHLDNFKYGYSNFKVLLNAQNRNLPVMNKILQELRNENVESANQEIRNYLNKFLFQNQTKVKDRLPYFNLEKISDPHSNSRVITICISGFTSQADVPNQSWRKLIGNTQGQIYSLGWESKTKKELTSFAWGQLQNLVKSQAFFQSPYLAVASIAKTLINTYKSNPFFEAFDHAVFCGELLGRLIKQIFPGYLINLISFSLGTQLVKQTLKFLKSQGKLDMINQVILIGGVANKEQLQKTIDKTYLDVTNCYTKNDSILKWLFKICKPFASPIGLNTVSSATNIDCSKFVDGHGKYRQSMDELRKRIELDDDTYYATNV